MRSIAAAVLLASFFICPSAHAILDWSSCAGDVATHCPGLTLGSDEAAQCLNKLAVPSASLSPAVKALTEGGAATLKHWQFHQTCKDDIQNLCAHVPAGDNRIHTCMWEQRQKTTSSCRLFLQEYLGPEYSDGNELGC
jgi:hypothetical protein